MTHSALCERAARWLKSKQGCVFACHELVAATGEIPDAIGFKAWASYLVEVKMSRADFLRNGKKRHQQQERGMGNFRWFLCPPGIIKPEELPERWGLIYAYENRIEEIVRPRNLKANTDSERIILVSLLRRTFDDCPYLANRLVRKHRRSTTAPGQQDGGEAL